MSLTAAQRRYVLEQLPAIKCRHCGGDLVPRDDGFSFVTVWGVSGAYVVCDDCGREEQKTVFVIEELWTDSLENQIGNAMGYQAVGFAWTPEDARHIVDQGGEVVGTGWPIKAGEKMRRRRAMPVRLMTPNV